MTDIWKACEQCGNQTEIKKKFCSKDCEKAYTDEEDNLINMCLKIHEYVEHGQIGHAVCALRKEKL